MRQEKTSNYLQPTFYHSLFAYIFNRWWLCYVTREKLKARNAPRVCECVCVLRQEVYFYLTCKSLRAEIHRGLCRGRREQQSIFRLRLTRCNPLCAATAKAAAIHPSTYRSIWWAVVKMNPHCQLLFVNSYWRRHLCGQSPNAWAVI